MATLNGVIADLALPTTASGTVSLSGKGWQPGFSMGMVTKQTGTSSALLAELALDLGFAVGTGTITQYSVYLAQNDAQNPPSTIYDFDSSKFFNIYNNNTNAGSQNGVCTITHDSGGLTLTDGSTSATEPDAAYEAAVLAIDSAAIANSKIGNFTSPFSTGDKAVTGLGFTPDVVLFFLAGPTGSSLPHAETAVDANNPNGIMLGAATTSAQWVATCGVASEGGDESPIAKRYFLTTKCISGWFWDFNSNGAGSGPTLMMEASLKSMDVGGFTTTFSTVDASTAYRIGYCALKMNTGYNVDVHSITSSTSTGSLSKTGMSFQPAALIGCHIGKGVSTAGTADADLELAVGMTDGTNSRCRSIYGQDLNGNGGAGGAPAAKSYQDMSNFLSYRSGSGSTAAEALAFTSFNSDGYTLNSTTAPASATAIGIIAFGPGGSSGTTGTFAATSPTPTLAAAGNTTVTGTLAATSPIPTLASSGMSTVTGTLAATSPMPSLAASGSPTVPGTFAATSPLPSLEASGTVGDSGTTGTFSATSPTPSLAASGTPTVSGTFAGTTTRPTLAASGTPTITGTFAATSPLPRLAATNIAETSFFARAHRRKQDRNFRPQ